MFILMTNSVWKLVSSITAYKICESACINNGCSFRMSEQNIVEVYLCSSRRTWLRPVLTSRLIQTECRSRNYNWNWMHSYSQKWFSFSAYRTCLSISLPRQFKMELFSFDYLTIKNVIVCVCFKIVSSINWCTLTNSVKR